MSRPRPETARTEPPGGVSAVFWRLLLAEPLREISVLDVGTGAGRIALGLAPHARRVVGVDRDAEAIAEARDRAAETGLTNVAFDVADAEAVEYDRFAPDLVTAHLCMSDAIAERASRALAPGRVFAAVSFHVDQWRETGGRSRFAYDEAEMARLLARTGFVAEHLSVDRDERSFASRDEALAAVAGLAPRWRADGRWARYLAFLDAGGRTLTRSHLTVKARRVGTPPA